MSNSLNSEHLQRLRQLQREKDEREATRKQREADAKRDRKEQRRKDKIQKDASEGMPAKIFALFSSEITDTRTGFPMKGLTAADIMYLAFPEEKASSIRFALWKLFKAGKVGKTGAKRNSGTGTKNLDVWDLIEKCPPQVPQEDLYALTYEHSEEPLVVVVTGVSKVTVKAVLEASNNPGAYKVYKLQLVEEVIK
jgi:hypothetical protein